MEKLNTMIEQGYQIKRADITYERESWHLPAWLKASLDASHRSLIYMNSETSDFADISESERERKHLINQMSEFIYFTNAKGLEHKLDEYLQSPKALQPVLERKLRIRFFRAVVSEIQEFLTDKMPFWKYDERLYDYGFSPVYYNATYHISDKIDLGNAAVFASV